MTTLHTTNSNNLERKTCRATLWFLEEAELYRTVKPYRLRFESPDPDLPRSNVICRRVDDVPIQDIRCRDPMDFDRVGFTFVNMDSKLTYADCADRKRLEQLYYKDLKGLLCKRFDTPHVVILDHTVRSHLNTNSDPFTACY